MQGYYEPHSDYLVGYQVFTAIILVWIFIMCGDEKIHQSFESYQLKTFKV